MTEEQVLTLLAVANKYPTDYTRLALDIHASFSKYFTNIFTSLKTDSQFVKGTLNWLDSGWLVLMKVFYVKQIFPAET